MTKQKILILVIFTSFSFSLILFSIFFLFFENKLKQISTSYNLTGQDVTTYQVEKKLVKTTITDLENQIVDVINQVWPAVVNIVISKNLKVFIENPFDFFWWTIIEKKEKIGWWSWIGITSDWYIITNKHVVADLNADYSVVTRDWDIYKVSKIWFDPVFDLAVIKVVDENQNPISGLQTAKIKSIKSPVKIWQFVVAIWNALWEYQNTATFGIISAKGRILEDLPPTVKSVYIWLYQTDAAINPWNSGWPLINLAWEVIGINTAISAMGQWIGFAMPISQELVEATLKSIEKYWAIKRPFLGVMYTHLNKSLAKSKWLLYSYGAYIEKVIPGSAADKAGLQPWDIILKINDIQINSDNMLPFVLFTFLPGEQVNLTVWKADEGKIKTVKVILDEYKQ